MSRKYDHEFKEKVAREAINLNNITATANKYTINKNSVRKWVNEYKVKMGMSDLVGIQIEGDKDVHLLKKEIIELRQQLEIMKKDLEEAIILIGEKDLLLKKLKGGKIKSLF